MTNPFNFFDKIYCINLKEREDRWLECLKIFEKYEITNFERIDGVKINGDLPSKRKGQIGCALAFAKCYEKIYNENLNNCLILEDDFYFVDEKDILSKKLNKSLNELPTDWDSLYFGATLINDYGIYPISKYSNNLYKLHSAHCLHATAFSNQGIKKLFQIFDNKNDWYKILINNFENMDVFMAQKYLNQTNSFITSELLCFQRPNYSNIENQTYDYSQWMINNFYIFTKNLK